MIGLKRGTVDISNYCSEWVKYYNNEAELLKSIAGEYIIDIQHVGSTSIKGLSAKPIIDIALGVKQLSDIDYFIQDLINIGYDYYDGAGCEDRVFLAKGEESFKTHYLHIEIFEGNSWFNHIVFRDALRNDDMLRDQYGELKKNLAQLYPDDRYEYSANKNHFIEKVISEYKKIAQ